MHEDEKSKLFFPSDSALNKDLNILNSFNQCSEHVKHEFNEEFNGNKDCVKLMFKYDFNLTLKKYEYDLFQGNLFYQNGRSRYILGKPISH